MYASQHPDSNLNSFKKNGYLLVKGVYKRDDLNALRDIFHFWFKEGLWKSQFNTKSIINDIYRISPGLLDVVFNQHYFDTIKSLLGENIVWLPECTVHRNVYVNWHKDTTTQEIDGVMSHYSDSAHLLQCATYFQDNNAWGGGLTVIPGSHRDKDRFTPMYANQLPLKALNKVKKVLGVSVFDQANKSGNVIDIPSEVGDLLVFDIRLDHKSTGVNVRQPAGYERFAIFNTFGLKNQSTSDYLEYMKSRPGMYYQYLRSTTFPRALYSKAKQFGIDVWN